ncbi:hypothetical protein ALP73_200004 [Pseudomonas coronafaciens pv. garcae]|uniref:hypothetical protein n=1 Tax=Pseudomonas syringae group TaxID=136849 RepID=UPI000F3B0D3F|nr:hypothetical protein [Pseudomonas coronafaciens]RMS04933.1 hypothetical protein ALP73_200004 [Pseudomonas coronafaciens pv. garcae]
MSEYDYSAESNGVVIGRRQGRREGYSEGFREADRQWVIQNEELRNSALDLQRECERLRNELNAANEKIRKNAKEANYCLTSFHVISLCFLDALDHLPPKAKNKIAYRYFDISRQWITSKHLRALPAEDPLLQMIAPQVASGVKNWCEKELAAEKNNKQEAANINPKR